MPLQLVVEFFAAFHVSLQLLRVFVRALSLCGVCDSARNDGLFLIVEDGFCLLLGGGLDDVVRHHRLEEPARLEIVDVDAELFQY